MQTKPSSKKSIIVIVIVVVVAAIVYFYFKGGSGSNNSSLLQTQSNPEAEAIGVRVLGLLNQIKSLHIDSAIFKSSAYQTLRDYSVEIPPQNVGRPNPFAPLP